MAENKKKEPAEKAAKQPAKSAREPYEAPKLMRFEKLEQLIVSGE